MKNKFVYLAAILFAVCFAANSYAKDIAFVKLADNFIVLYDSSSSMGKTVLNGTEERIDVERKILQEKSATLPELDWQAGMYTFTPGFSPEAFETFIPMQTYNKDLFVSTINSLPSSPRGTTLLQYGLTQLEPILKTLPGKTVIFLFTDGQYTVNSALPAPGMIAKRLAKKHDVCFYVIDTDDDTAGDEVVSSIANATECGKVVKFSKLLGHPEWMTNPLFMVKEMDQAQPMIVGKTFNNVLFDFDKSNIKPEYNAALNELASYLKDNPQAHVTLAGFTDSIGSQEYNLKLSQRRAASVRAYLVDKAGVASDRITLSWFGKSKPVAPNDNDADRAKNRRVESIITGM